jgi:hypothetical protein
VIRINGYGSDEPAAIWKPLMFAPTVAVVEDVEDFIDDLGTSKPHAGYMLLGFTRKGTSDE